MTEPLIRALTGSPDIQTIRGTSHMGYSFIYVILADGAAAHARAAAGHRSHQRDPAAAAADAVVTLGPNASSMGWIYQYALVDREGLHDLRELRLLNEGQIKPALQAVPGVAEVASVGGLEKQYQVKLFPPMLARTGLSLQQVIDALQRRRSGGRRPHDRGDESRVPAARRDRQRQRATSSSISCSAAIRLARRCS